MNGTEELQELNEMLRIGLRTVREIARLRPNDYDRLMDIAARSEVLAADLDEILGTAGHGRPARPDSSKLAAMHSSAAKIAE